MTVEELREGRGRAATILTNFMSLKDKHFSSIFCNFEGIDSKYYLNKIENSTNYNISNIITFNCNGKSQVIRLYHLIQNKNEYKDVNIAYFIDKDFDTSIEIEDIYETKCYSIENFYTTKEAFVRILRAELGYNETDPEFNFLQETYMQRQREFHEKSTLFNAWLACQREKAAKEKTENVDVTDFKITKLIPTINIDAVVGDYTLDDILQLFPHAPSIEAQELERKIELFKKGQKQQIYRGKLEIDFLFEFLNSISQEFKKEECRCEKKEGVRLNPSKKNILSEYSHYADTPSCLIAYLNKHKQSTPE